MKKIDELNEQSKEAVGNGGFSGFSPDHLLIDGREELWVFPHNILFAKFRGEPDGSNTMGRALYNPELSSFKHDKEKWSMTYRNEYGAKSYVVITIKTADLSYRGDKFVDGICVGFGTGKIKDDANGRGNGWDDFFFNLTMLGLSPDEPCLFTKVIEVPE